MTEFKKIPHDVYEVMNHHSQGFDKMYYRFLSNSDSQTEAFNKSIDRIREYFPQYKGYSSLFSYLTTKTRRTRNMLNTNKKTKFNN